MKNTHSNLLPHTKQRPVAILGINSAYHEPSASIIVDGEVVAAVEEERFNRIRHGKKANLRNPHILPENAIKYCLSEAGISPANIDQIGFSFSPEKRLSHNLKLDEEVTSGGSGSIEGEELFYNLLKSIPIKLCELLQTDIRSRFRWIDHHLCHAASAYYASGLNNSAILSIDGIGEFTSIWMGQGKGQKIEMIREIAYPNSMGFLWTKTSRFLGFGEYGQWKVMALGAFGDSSIFYDNFRSFITYDQSGNFNVDGHILQFRINSYEQFEKLFGSARKPGEPLEQRHYDVAAALQKITNELVLQLSNYLANATGSKALCYSGGVALNCVTNRKLIEESPFDSVFIQPAANDAGTSLGAAYYLWNHICNYSKSEPVSDMYLGPEYSIDSLRSYLNQRFVGWSEPSMIEKEVAALLAKGKIGVIFQGRMEFGPRALGNRSIIADPRRSDMVHILNDRIKHREFFRPFAASILEENVHEWFQISRFSSALQYMLLAYPVRPEKLGQIPAVTHVDSTSRIQTVSRSSNRLFYDIIKYFYTITGVPMLLNTSFNDQEPIICTPENALNTALRSGIDFIVMDKILFDLTDIKTLVNDSKPDPSNFIFNEKFAKLLPSENGEDKILPWMIDSNNAIRELKELLDIPIDHVFTCR